MTYSYPDDHANQKYSNFNYFSSLSRNQYF